MLVKFILKMKTLNKLLSTTVFIQPFIAAEKMDA